MLPNGRTRPGLVYTFYSYKGGVGRSMALANVAALLAKWGRRVLVVDWDLEASGIERYFLSDNPELADILEVLRIPYIPVWSFGERLPVKEEGITDPQSLGYAYSTLTRLIHSDMEWDLVLSPEQVARRESWRTALT